MISKIEKSFYLAYQPIVDRNKKIVKYEVLSRWDFEQIKITPQELIDWAEDDIGGIILLDAMVFKRFTKDFNELKLKNNVKFCLNVSPITLGMDPNFILNIESVIKSTTAKRVEVEVLESKVKPELEFSVQTALRLICQKGIGISLDDFGNGHACVRKLIHGYTNIKIDGELVSKIHLCSRTKHVVSTVIELAHTLGKTVTAEKIECTEQYHELLAIDCDFFQGFFFGRPMKLEDLNKPCYSAPFFWEKVV
ncbi:hypothetical protein CYQ88_08305 [Hydrogenovibrio sp. SC-1]|uniref:EAL domain-containing protein n=1 Tax=Hydrogenovibrio sp. SC-1 TaxID=2065820 RepID=UPI000C7D88A5|nr:EAL domain-containing protein [Hydrogenovibrio sp. SC-1]PLA73956.1 hypothetical protein CYQ88_08305 [Hydrogenovibrio sp. SC-1]